MPLDILRALDGPANSTASCPETETGRTAIPPLSNLHAIPRRDVSLCNIMGMGTEYVYIPFVKKVYVLSDPLGIPALLLLGALIIFMMVIMGHNLQMVLGEAVSPARSGSPWVQPPPVPATDDVRISTIKSTPSSAEHSQTASIPPKTQNSFFSMDRHSIAGFGIPSAQAEAHHNMHEKARGSSTGEAATKAEGVHTKLEHGSQQLRRQSQRYVPVCIPAARGSLPHTNTSSFARVYNTQSAGGRSLACWQSF